MRNVGHVNSILLGVRRYSDAAGRFSQVDHVDYQNQVVVYSIISEVNGTIMSGYRTTLQDVLDHWKILDQNERHPWQKKREEAQNS